MLNRSCILCYDWTGRRIFPLSQVVWSFNCLVEGGSTPLRLEEKSLKNGISHQWISESRAHPTKTNQPKTLKRIFHLYKTLKSKFLLCFTDHRLNSSIILFRIVSLTAAKMKRMFSVSEKRTFQFNFWKEGYFSKIFCYFQYFLWFFVTQSSKYG